MIRRELASNKHSKDTMQKIGVAIKQIYPATACGKGDAFNGSKNRE